MEAGSSVRIPKSNWRRARRAGPVTSALALVGIAVAWHALTGVAGTAAAIAVAQYGELTPAVISGEVKRTTDGEVAPSLDVWAAEASTGTEANRSQTDRTGRFVLSVPPGRYVVTAGAPGYVPSSYGSGHHSLPGSPIVVSAGQREEIRIMVRRAPVVRGVVRDDFGRPIDNATVEILRPSTLHEHERWVVTSTTTDTNGAYRAEGLLPGEFLAVAMPMRPTSTAKGSVQFQTPSAQFFPGTDAESGATHIVLDADEQRSGVDFALPHRPLTRLTGILVVPESVKLFGEVLAIVTGVDDSPPTWDAPPVRAGRFELLLHRGRYRVDIRAFGTHSDRPPQSEGRLYAASAVVDVEESGGLLREFRLGEALRVSGHVRATRSAGLRVRFTPPPSRRPAAVPVEAPTSADGRFTVEGISPGRYRCEVIDGEKSRVLDTVRFRGQEQLSTTIDIEESVGADDLELTVVPTTASLSGMVLGARDAPSHYLIGLLREDGATQGARPSLRYLTRPDNRGGYLFSSLRPGPYVLFLVRNPNPAYLNSRVLMDDVRGDAAGAIRITLIAGTQAALDLRIEKP